ncbi:putative reverse transcriptase domain-containing protein [Tanacetum coccineum]
MAPTTRGGPNTPINNTNPNNMTPESIQAMIDQTLLRNATNGDGSHSLHRDNRRNVQTARPCFYADFMKCQPLNFKGAEGVVGLTRWIEKMESVFNISGPEAYAMTWEDTEKMTDKVLYRKGQSDNKRKADDSSRNNHGHQQQPFKRQNIARVYNMGTGERKPYGGSLPKCNKCHLHHNGPCTQRCHKCNKIGHFARDCRSTGNTNVANTQKGNGATPKGNGCFECGAPGHFKRDCPKLKNKNGGNGNAQGWVYAVGNAEKRGNAPGNPDANVVTGTFLLNNHYASILFDTGADRSFISTAFSSLINIAPTSLENCYDVELADGKLVKIDTIIRGCTLNFLDHPFNIDLMPVELGSFDVIIGMDWLRKYHAVIVCDEKLVQVPYGNETLTFRGNESSDGRESRLTVISCSKAQEYMAKGCQVFLAQISAKKEEDKSERKQIEDVPIVRDFPEVFPEDLPGLPPARPVEFQIDLIPGAAPWPLARDQNLLKDRSEIRKSPSLEYIIGTPETALSNSVWPLRVPGHAIWIDKRTCGLAGYYRRFIEGFSKIAKSMTKLTQKGIKFDWGEKEENAFQLIKQKLCSAPILALPKGSEDFVVYCDASHKGLDSAARIPASIIFDREWEIHFKFWRIICKRALGTDISMSTAYHPETDGQSERTIQTLEDMLRACVIDFGKGWCAGPRLGKPIEPSRNLIQETTEKIILIKQRMQEAQDRQKSYADRKRKPMEFEVGDRVLAKVGKVAYRLELPQELSRVHHTFHVSNLKKCYADEPLVMPLEGIHVDDKLQFVEEPVEIMEREIKRLKRSRIPLVKVRWNSRRGPEFTWEREDSFKQKYPQLFTNRASSSTTRS